MTSKLQRGSRKPEIDGILLDEKFRLLYKDDRNIMLEEFITYQDKEEVEKTKWDFKGYYYTIAGGIKAYCNIQTLRAKNMDDLLAILDTLHDKIENQFQVHLDG